jgi:hypothetical protein
MEKKASGLCESAHNQVLTKFSANCCKKGTKTQVDQSDYKQSLLLLLHSLLAEKSNAITSKVEGFMLLGI